MSLVVERMNEITTFTSLQGNIGSGKTTLLNAMRKHVQENGLLALEAAANGGSVTPRDLFIFLDEPVAKWSEPTCCLLNCHGEGEDATLYSYLDLFYKGQPKTQAQDDAEEKKTTSAFLNPVAFPFQIHAFTTRLAHLCQQIEKMPRFSKASNTRIHVISERSLRTDRLFFKNVYESGNVSRYLWETYDAFFDVICRATLNKEDAMIYINTSPEKSYDRLYNKRKRDAEVGNAIPLEYLQSLHRQHQTMIEDFGQAKGRDRIVEINFEHDMDQEEIERTAIQLIEDMRAKIYPQL